MADEEKRKRGAPWLTMWGLFLLVCYPLGVGPIQWLHDRGLIPDSALPAIRIIYFPVIWLHETFPWFERLLDRYMELWVD